MFLYKWVSVKLIKIYFFALQYIQTDPPTKESLCQLIIQFIQYQETKFGKNASEHLLTRLPVCYTKIQNEKFKFHSKRIQF